LQKKRELVVIHVAQLQGFEFGVMFLDGEMLGG